ncbi:E3 ubiquitin-protein ligase XIAP-like [Physella acuta]|uniref:E3 ubiquitin-protein ligase XIAP-like n=1 Tax=Physella acuta TaxID=109671 RepID=UPI0027DDFAA9|nr:E3 ubiquitin-protein ligase XIAP-like [Physella acuta]
MSKTPVHSYFSQLMESQGRLASFRPLLNDNLPLGQVFYCQLAEAGFTCVGKKSVSCVGCRNKHRINKLNDDPRSVSYHCRSCRFANRDHVEADQSEAREGGEARETDGAVDCRNQWKTHLFSLLDETTTHDEESDEEDADAIYYSRYLTRLESLQSWNSPPQIQPHLLASYGLYYRGIRNAIQCYKCKWIYNITDESTDVIINKHIRYDLHCTTATHGDSFTASVSMEDFS